MQFTIGYNVYSNEKIEEISSRMRSLETKIGSIREISRSTTSGGYNSSKQ